MKIKKALLIVESPSESMERAFSVLTKPTKKYAGMEIISFPDYETFGKVISGVRLELLTVIRSKKPNSIQELARFVKRDYKNVYQDVKLLADFGLIDLKEQGPRKSAAPVSKFNEFVLVA